MGWEGERRGRRCGRLPSEPDLVTRFRRRRGRQGLRIQAAGNGVEILVVEVRSGRILIGLCHKLLRSKIAGDTRRGSNIIRVCPGHLAKTVTFSARRTDEKTRRTASTGSSESGARDWT